MRWHPGNERIARQTHIMSISIKTPEEIEGMRIAGRLGAEVLDYITPSSRPA
jgi:hypothetical protein